jgi:ubiquinone biosynthesis protein UbiJ
MHEAIRKAVEPLVTRDEMREAIGKAIEPLATKVDVREEGLRTRRHFDVVAESLTGDIRLIAEGQVHLQQSFEELRTELKTDMAGLDRRLMRLEASR